MAEEVDRVREEDGLLERAVQTFAAEALEHALDVAAVLGDGGRLDDDVVEVDVTNFANVVAEGREHATLMSGGCITASHGHYGPLV